MIELAFLRGFLAWEGFLEESFLLFMLGKRDPSGRAAHRFVSPPSWDHAFELTKEGRDYSKWETPGEVSARAERFFRGGKPFAPVLRMSINTLQDAKTIRNAVAHRAVTTHDKLLRVVRNHLAVVPPALTVGRFLDTIKPGSTPPTAFLEFYLGTLEQAAKTIVRR